jgi:(S)-3,5-dihydroxyphenylglycine transaminase
MTATSPPTTALTLDDYARLARERLDLGVSDFIEGGAGDEVTLGANRAAFDRIRLRPRVLRSAGSPAIGTTILGQDWDAPVAIAPLAFHTLADPDGELATVRGTAATLHVPVTVSTLAGRSIEEVAAQRAGVPLWFQLYCFRDRSVTRALIRRAEAAGYEALVLTVDAPHLGRRLRDLRNDFRMPPGVVAANLSGPRVGVPAVHARREFEADLDWSVVDWLRTVTGLPILLKGILNPDDARRAVESGVDGIVVSNHGGRQLDGVPATLEALPEVVATVGGRLPVLLDGGIRRGRDVLAALALGADAVLLGRPVLHGLAVAAEQGVTAVLDLLVAELQDTMSLAGVRSLRELGPEVLLEGPSVDRRPAVRWESTREPVRAAGRAETPAMAAGPTTAKPVGADLAAGQLHSSVTDPMMDTMNFLNEITLRYPQAVSFAPGRPYDGFFDTEQVFGYIRRYLDHLQEQGRSPAAIRDAVFQYGPAAGQIRELIADSLRVDEDIDVPAESVVVTVGCQEAMFLALRALVGDPSDAVLVSSPCYVGISGAARLLDIDVTAVEEGPEGLRAADLEVAIRAEQARGRRVRVVYVIPDHSNPSGVTIPLAARRDLLELASRYDFLILEDSPYRLVSPGQRLPTLKSLDRERRVVHLGSYSKTVFPGARVGFAVADQVVMDPDGGTTLLADALAKIKSMVTVNTSALSQAAVAGALLESAGRVSQLNTRNAAHYEAALQCTLRHLERHFPAERRQELGISWNVPAGGFFLALTVPFRADNAALTRSAEGFSVIWTPMSYFYPGGGGEGGIRLSISYLSEAEIQEGVARLADFIKSEVTAG